MMNCRLHSEVSSNLAWHFSFHQSSHHQWLRWWSIARHSTSTFQCIKVSTQCYSWLTRQLRLFSASSAEDIDWYNSIISSLKFASSDHSVWVLMIFVADYVSRCLNDSASSLHVFNTILSQLLRLIWKVDSYQSYSLLSFFLFSVTVEKSRSDQMTRCIDKVKRSFERSCWKIDSFVKWKKLNINQFAVVT